MVSTRALKIGSLLGFASLLSSLASGGCFDPQPDPPSNELDDDGAPSSGGGTINGQGGDHQANVGGGVGDPVGGAGGNADRTGGEGGGTGGEGGEGGAVVEGGGGAGGAGGAGGGHAGGGGAGAGGGILGEDP